MATTNFVAGTTITSAWLNDVDGSTYQGQLDDGTTNASIDKYLPAGTGASTTTVQAKLRESISVKDFGAVGDGSTDDYTAIQAALTFAGLTGGSIYFPQPSVRYLFGTALLIPSAVAMFGDGKYSSFLRYTGTGTALSADGSGNNSVTIADMTVDVTGNNAVVLDASRFISSTFRSVRFRGLTGTGQTGVKAYITNVAWTSYFNDFIDCTFDGAFANAVSLDRTVAQYPNRWRFVSPTFLSNVNSMNLAGVQGIQVIGPVFNEHTGTAVILGATADRCQFTSVVQETNVGGTLWAINAACNRFECLGVKNFAGTDGSGSGIGIRGMYMGDWDVGIRFSGSTTATAISTISCGGNVGVDVTGVKSIGRGTTAGNNLRGSATFATSNQVTVTFGTAEPDSAYWIAISGQANETFWISNQAAGSFRINSSNATSTAQVNWILVR